MLYRWGGHPKVVPNLVNLGLQLVLVAGAVINCEVLPEGRSALAVT